MDQNVEKVAEQTEIPVSQVHSPSSKAKFKIKDPKIIIAVIVAFLVIVGLVAFIFLNKANNSPEVAQQAFNSGNYDKAIEIYKKDAKNGNSPEALIGTLKSIASKGNETGQEGGSLKEAQPYIDDALKNYPEDPNVLSSIGYTYETGGEYDKALEYYDKASKLDPKSAAFIFQRGHALEFLGRRSEAYADYEKAYALDPNNSQILMARGNMLLSQGKPQESYESFLKASKVSGIANVSKAEALTGASLVRGSQESFKYVGEAVGLSQEAVNASPEFSPALAAHGYNLYLTSPDKKTGIPFVEKAITANPRISRNYLLLGTMYRADDNFDKATEYFQKAITAVDNDNTILSKQDRQIAKGNYTYELAKTQYYAGQLTSFIPLIKEAILLNPSLKAEIKEEFESKKMFEHLSDNQEFLTLISG